MKEYNLTKMIDSCYEICQLLEQINPRKSANITLKNTLRIEFLKFATYLITADDCISQEELACIKEHLGFSMTEGSLKKFKINEGVNPVFSTIVPVTLKHFVLADAKKTLPKDPYENQKAQILVDTFKCFGQTIISCHASEQQDETTVANFTTYTTMLDNFLKEYGVFKTSSEKLFHAEPITTSSNVDIENPETVEQILEDLNQLIGLNQVKEEVSRLVNLIRVQKIRAERGFKNISSSKHMVFSGNPGTGKTTVARLLGKIYKKLGVLSSGQLIEVDRSNLVSGYVGQTAIKTQEMIDKAMGGILFIDEAYSLTVNKGENDFGQEAVDTLLKAMEDHRDNFLVIVAGYPEPMEEFLASNPGLKSRFNKFINFEDYTTDEQLFILELLCKQQEYHFSPDALEAANSYFEERTKNKPANFANARDIRNFMEKAIANHASRIVSIEQASDEELTCIQKEDLLPIISMSED